MDFWGSAIETSTLPDEWTLEWTRRQLSTFEETRPLIESIATAMASVGYPRDDIFGVRLALEEALVNAIKHGHRNDPYKQVAVRYRVNVEHVLVEIEDEGDGFNPLDVPDPTAPENLERPSGRGLLLMRNYLSWIHHNEWGNCVTLCKYPSVPLPH